jgi:N-methylhydantoinase B/oxoprolinase/acetone carboxylase alpha subunit
MSSNVAATVERPESCALNSGALAAATLHSAFTETLEYTERIARATIESLPDGRYEFTDHFDDDGIDPDPIPIKAAIEIRGSDLSVDFEGPVSR